MDIFEADVSDSAYLVDNLWRPMMVEMEDLSEMNKLADGEIKEDAFKYFSDRLNSERHVVFVAEIKDDPAGFIAFEKKSGQSFFDRGLFIHVHELFVAEEYRRKGIASKLLERAEAFCSENGYEMIQLSVNVENIGAQELYDTQGFDRERLKMIKEL